MSGRLVVRAVVHDLGRTGVPISLTRLATWPEGRQAIDLHVVARHDGPLRSELEQAGIPVVALEPEQTRSAAATVAVGATQLGWTGAGRSVLGTAWRRRVRALPAPDVVLLHGAGAWPVADALRLLDGHRVVLHLHELEVALHRSIPPTGLAALAAVDRVLAVSEPVAALARTLGVRADRVAVVPDPVDQAEPIEQGGTDVVSVGDAGWRKGTDRAIAAAHELRRTDPALRWHWVGRGPEPGWAYAVGAELPVAFHPPSPEPWAVVDAPAALVVTSREDPLPIVALEAAVRGIPVVATRGSGGLDQLLAEGRGRLVDPVDPRALAAAVAEVARTRPTDAAAALRDHVLGHHALEAVGPRWLAALVDGT